MSGVDDRGVVRLCVLGNSVRACSLWLPMEPDVSGCGELELPLNDGELSLCGLKTVLDRERPEGVHRILKSCVGWRLGVGAAEGAGVDLPENGLERIEVDGLLGLNEGLEGLSEDGALGVNDGLEGAEEGALLGLNDGPGDDLLGLNDGPEEDLPGLNDGLEPKDELRPGLGLGLDLVASRLAAIPLMVAPRLEPPRPAITFGVACSRTAAITTHAMAVLRSFLSPAANMAVSFPSPAAFCFRGPSPPEPPTPDRGRVIPNGTLMILRAATLNILLQRLYGLHATMKSSLDRPLSQLSKPFVCS